MRRGWWTVVRRRRLDIRMWVVDHAPVALLTHAHEVAVALVLLVMGVPAAMGALPGQGEAGIPSWAWHLWSWALILGAGGTIVGLFTSRPRAEWVGQMLAGWGLGLFAYRLAFLGLQYTYPTVLTFAVLASVSWWRAWKITSVALVQHRLTRAAREAHRQVYGRDRL
jgi:hypothetical protein